MFDRSRLGDVRLPMTSNVTGHCVTCPSTGPTRSLLVQYGTTVSRPTRSTENNHKPVGIKWSRGIENKGILLCIDHSTAHASFSVHLVVEWLCHKVREMRWKEFKSKQQFFSPVVSVRRGTAIVASCARATCVDLGSNPTAYFSFLFFVIFVSRMFLLSYGRFMHAGFLSSQRSSSRYYLSW